MKRTTYRGVCVTLILCMLFVQGLAQIDQAVASTPLGIPTDALDEVVGAAMAAEAAPNFLALAKYAWSGQVPDGTVVPASASAAASAGTSYEASVHRALDVLVMLFPQEAANINNNRRQLVASIVNGDKKAPRSLRNIKHASAPASPTDVTAASILNLTPCHESIFVVAVDLAGLVMTVATFDGPPPKWAKVSKTFKDSLRTMGSNWIAGFKVLIANVRNATTIGSRVTALYKLVKEIFDQGGSLLVEAFKEELSWWDWVEFGVTIVLAIGAFSLSGGGFMTVKLANIIYTSYTFGLSLKAFAEACD